MSSARIDASPATPAASLGAALRAPGTRPHAGCVVLVGQLRRRPRASPPDRPGHAQFLPLADRACRACPVRMARFARELAGPPARMAAGRRPWSDRDRRIPHHGLSRPRDDHGDQRPSHPVAGADRDSGRRGAERHRTAGKAPGRRRAGLDPRRHRPDHAWRRRRNRHRGLRPGRLVDARRRRDLGGVFPPAPSPPGRSAASGRLVRQRRRRVGAAPAILVFRVANSRSPRSRRSRSCSASATSRCSLRSPLSCCGPMASHASARPAPVSSSC